MKQLERATIGEQKMTDEKTEKVIERLFGGDDLMKGFMRELANERDVALRVRELRRDYDQAIREDSRSYWDNEKARKLFREMEKLVFSQPEEKQRYYMRIWKRPQEYDRTWRI